MKNKGAIINFLKSNRLIFLAFAIPAVLLVLGFAITRIYPFGSNQILVIDMYHQYVPFLSELQHKLQNGESLFYSWDGAAGGNFWNLIAYYGASPLNLLLILFPASHVVEGVTLILTIKIGLAGAFMAIYLRETHGVCNLGTVAFTTLYALCAYVMGYYWCIMWMDAVMLLPLVIMGLNRIIQERSPVLYVITLALIVFINYYIAIMVCIFILFYFPVTYFIQVRNKGKIHCLFTTLRAVGYSLLAIAMSAVMLLPTYLSMQSTYYIDSEMPDTWEFYSSAMDLLNQLLPDSQLTYREGLPNVYCGLLVVMLVIFFIVDKTIKLKEKTVNIGLLCFLFLSLNINKLDFIWHGLHFPNQLPYRYSFIVSFILVGMAYKAFLHIDKVKLNTVWAAMAGILAWYVLAQKLLDDKIDNTDEFLYIGVALLITYTAIIVCYKKRIIRREYFMYLIVLAVAVEMGSNVVNSFNKVGNTDREYYFQNYSDVRKLVEQVDDELARVELDDNFILNTPALYHYKGVSQFSSSINATTTQLMEEIGVEGEPGKNRFNYNLTTPVLNAMLNVKYLISKSGTIADDSFAEVSSCNSSKLYENKYPLSMGYMVPQSIWSWETGLDNPFSVQDDYIRAATDGTYDSVYNYLSPTNASGDNITLNENGEDAWITETQDSSNTSTVSITYTADETKNYYVFVEADSCESITVDNNSDDGVSIRKDCGSIVNIGSVNKGETFTVNIEYKEGDGGSIVCHAASLNDEAWQGAYETLSSNTWNITEWSDTHIKGTITSESYQVFATSIPYDKGWTLKVDGKERDIDQLVGGGFIGTSLTKGTHEVELTFTPPGIKAGALISLLAILILIASRKLLPTLIKRRNARKQAKLPMPEESDQEESDYNTVGTDYYFQEEQEECPS